MLIKRFLNILGFIGLLIFFNSVTNLQLYLPINHVNIFNAIALLYIIYLVRKYKKIINDLAKKITANKKIFLILEIIFVGGLFYFLTRELTLVLGTSNNTILKLVSYTKIPAILFITSVLLLFIFPDKKNTHNYLSIFKSIISNKKTRLLVLISIITLGFGFRVYNLGTSDIRGDEFQVIGAATGYLNTGKYYQWDWISNKAIYSTTTDDYSVYDRAWPHTWMIAQSYKFFGISEASSRIPSVIFGTLLIVLTYPVALFFSKNKNLAVITTFLVAISPAYIGLSRYARMYIVLLPLFLGLAYSVYQTITKTYVPKWLGSKKTRLFLEQHLPFHWGFAILSILLLYFNYQIHINSLVIVPATMLFAPLAYIIDVKNRKRWKVFTLLSVLGMILFATLYLTGNIYFSQFFTYFEKRNFQYLDFLFAYPFGMVITLGLFLLAFLASLVKKNIKITFLGIIVLFGWMFFVYIANRYPAFVYTSHLTILVIIVSVIGLYTILKKLHQLFAMIIFFILLVYFTGLGGMRIGDRYDYQGQATHSQAYRVIVDNYDQNKHTLFLQFGRTFYLRELNEAKIVSMLNYAQYSLEDFLSDLEKAESGWIAWETSKSYHLETSVITYIKENFEKLHGSGIDETGVEVYYFE